MRGKPAATSPYPAARWHPPRPTGFAGHLLLQGEKEADTSNSDAPAC
jgi:hypothetical protein